MHDVFSGSLTVVEPPLPAEEPHFTVPLSVERHGVQNGGLPIAPETGRHPFACTPERRDDLSSVLPLQHAGAAGAVRACIATFMPERGRIHPRHVLSDVSEAIRHDVRHAARDAMGTQRPAQTLTLGTGSCRDVALLMMEAARGLGMAARFVSGCIDGELRDRDAAPVGDASVVAPAPHEIESRDAGGARSSGATPPGCTSTCRAPAGCPSIRPTGRPAAPT